MPSLPTVGGSTGTWGTQLNEYLGVSHAADGTLKYAFNVRDYGAVADGVTDDASEINAAVTACIAAGGGTVYMPAGTYRINSAIDLSGMKGTNRALTFRGAGTGYVFSGGTVPTPTSGATYIKNYNAGPAIKAYGTLVAGDDKPLVGLTIADLFIENQQSIGSTNYVVDVDYIAFFGYFANIAVEGGGFAGNGFRVTNTSVGGMVQSQLAARNFPTGIGHYLGAEVTTSPRSVDTALNSGNSVHNCCQSTDCLIGMRITGTTLFNSMTFNSTKVGCSYDITDSIGVYISGAGINGVDNATHVERSSTGILLEGTRGWTSISPLTSYPTGTAWLTTGSITTGTATLTLTRACLSNGDNVKVEGAGVAGADLTTTVAGGGDTTTVTLSANAGTTVSSARVAGRAAGIRYTSGAKHTSVFNHRASGTASFGYYYSARFDGGSGNDHSAWNAGGITTMFGGDQLIRNNNINLTEDTVDGSFGGRTGTVATARRDECKRVAERILTETLDKHGCSTSQPLVTQVAQGMAIGLCAGETVTGVAAELLNSPTSLTLLKLGLYDKAGNRLAVTASQHSTWTAAAHKDVPFVTPYYIRDDDLYYIVILAVCTGTLPSMLSEVVPNAAVANATNSGSRPNVSQSGRTDLTSTLTFGAGAGGFWMAVY